MGTLTTTEVKEFYDHFGSRQDRQLFYEAPALKSLLSHADFDNATSVVEFGCGTGRLALELLTDYLAPTATYHGLDVSSTMIHLARERVASFSPRAIVVQSDGETKLALEADSADRFLATYVLDLLSSSAIRDLLAEAYRVLQPSGLLCLAGISPGTTPLSRVVMSIWKVLFSIRPSLVGGCRPIHLSDHSTAPAWQTIYHETVVAFGISSEILVASPRKDSGDS